MSRGKKKHGKGKMRDPRLGEIKYDAQGKMIDDRNTEAGAKLGYKNIVRENKLFEEFYRRQEVCDQEEFPLMVDVLKTDLPASFR